MGPVLIWYNIEKNCKCCISGDIGIEKLQHISIKESNSVDRNVVISNIHMQMIFDIPVSFGK